MPTSWSRAQSLSDRTCSARGECQFGWFALGNRVTDSSLPVSDCSQGLSHKLNLARSTRQWVSACVSFGRWFLTESWNRSQFVVQKVLSTPDAWAILLSSWLKPSIKGTLSLAIFPASCSSFGSFTSSSWSAAWLSLSQISLESRNHVELRDMRHGTSLAGRVWGRSGNVKKKWRTAVDRDVIELFLLSALAPWCSVSEPVCIFKVERR